MDWESFHERRLRNTVCSGSDRHRCWRCCGRTRFGKLESRMLICKDLIAQGQDFLILSGVIGLLISLVKAVAENSC